MKSAGDILKNNDIKDLVSRAREQTSNITKEQERLTKDIGGIIVPSAFQVPNEIIDEGWLRELNGSEVKILIFIIRKTFGFNKIAGDRIPLSQITEATGLTRQSAISAVSVLEKVGLIRVIRSRSNDGMRNINYYQLITRSDYNKSKNKG